MKAYLLDGSTVRRLGERWGVHGATAWRRIQRSIPRNVEVGTVVCFRLPKVMPVILLDAKHFKIRKSTFTLYVAFDPAHRKPLAWLLLPRSERREGYEQILSVFRLKGFKIEATVSDNDQSIRCSIDDWFPSAVQQKCAFHVLKKAFMKLSGRRLIQTEYGRKLWKAIRKIVLEYDDEKKARAYFLKAAKKYPRHAGAWRVIERNLESVYRFTERRDLRIPRTSNRIENFMGVLEQRLKSFRSSKCPKSLLNILSQFIKIKYKSPTN